MLIKRYHYHNALRTCWIAKFTFNNLIGGYKAPAFSVNLSCSSPTVDKTEISPKSQISRLNVLVLLDLDLVKCRRVGLTCDLLRYLQPRKVRNDIQYMKAEFVFHTATVIENLTFDTFVAVIQYLLHK